ncbi:hypothetical protein [Pseudovibrio sp. Tun.PSC04-5.I4]|uniref:hypothetical protein n=1 Tax=Pseudovibrio sp. Tun.PSC04-5.I4 TaxID=1798213 RepID=UPI000884F910|nr:hypothetical protein [Pseudovibrio sp. Tun.PSC04-5.I4]SDR39145.1 hypothetical protein SAMN04515695_5268 [Pseudovibrio sp. Tun.PSC04-5.I4]
MPTVLCKFKDIDDFFGKYDKSGWDAISKKEKVGAKDKVKFSKVIGSGKQGLRKAFDQQVEESPIIAKYTAAIESIDKAIKAKAPIVSKMEEANHNIKIKMLYIKGLEDQAKQQKTDISKDENYKNQKSILKDMVKERQPILKSKKEYDSLQEKLKVANSACEKKKKEVATKVGVSVQSDGSKLIVYIGKRDEAAVKFLNS